MRKPENLIRIREYLRINRKLGILKEFLGDGTDGEVWSTEYDTAIKAHDYQGGYENERDAYLRLAEYGVTAEINGFSIPKMLGYNDELWIIEMDLVLNPPYIIDFAKVRINFPPDFTDEVLADQDVKGIDDFGTNWPEVKSLMAALESFQIYYLDPTPSNIVFRK